MISLGKTISDHNKERKIVSFCMSHCKNPKWSLKILKIYVQVYQMITLAMITKMDLLIMLTKTRGFNFQMFLRVLLIQFFYSSKKPTAPTNSTYYLNKGGYLCPICGKNYSCPSALDVRNVRLG